MLNSELHQFNSSFNFWRDLSFVIVFLTITPITLFISLFSLVVFHNEKKPSITNYDYLSGIRVYASLPREFTKVSGYAQPDDARVEIIKNYLIRYKSPLSGMEEFLVQKADEYDLDFRLLVAIAQQESNLCKIIPQGTYNCWGWGIHSKGTLGFDSYEKAIDAVAKGLKTEYIDKGLTTPDTIWKKYTPGSPDGAWAKGVNQFMVEME